MTDFSRFIQSLDDVKSTGEEGEEEEEGKEEEGKEEEKDGDAEGDDDNVVSGASGSGKQLVLTEGVCMCVCMHADTLLTCQYHRSL